MSSFPDFVVHGYQITKELGHNLEGGRFTYLAKRLTDNVDVAIKQFQFATGAGWDGFRAIEREIQSLQGLNHRGIPKYLDKFETANGYCLVTEYFPADTLAVGRSFTPDEIKQIAVQLLEILVYLQERMPPVIHRDIKPENILVDNNLNVYLIDFGFARVGSGSVAMSSANAGTFGFMAPEQIRNLKLTNASDLYGLGLTLICLIGAIRSTDIGNYIDFSNQLDRSKIDPKLKRCSLTFVKWLDQMVAPDPSKRFADAKIALESLKPLYVVRVPEVKFFKDWGEFDDGVEFDPNKEVLEFKATKLDEKLERTIKLVNSIPETVLEGHWEVAPHKNDGYHTPDNHTWILFSQKNFKSNHIHCTIIVDTSKLVAQKRGQRNIILYLNTDKKEYKFVVVIETASLPIETGQISVRFITQFFLVPLLVGAMLIFLHISILNIYSTSTPYIIILFLIAIGLFNIVKNFAYGDVTKRWTLVVSLILGISIVCTYFLITNGRWFVNSDIIGSSQLIRSKLMSFYDWLSTYSLIIYGTTIANACWLGYFLFYPSIERQHKIVAYRRKEEHLIKP
ncbi:MAG: serine/threonine-protein kinase [Pseudanabaenaceae cyanobacterium bins.39]|nr:serine/threonine-protein kinase [Pseudanabaenaceae cyanobacterium bins.39]